MELLKEIKDSDVMQVRKLRETSRAIAFDKDKKVPLLFIGKENCHILPGGGLREGEDKKQALMREFLEETGCEIRIEKEVGMIVEVRARWRLKQTSYCYIGKILSKGSPRFTKNELRSGVQILWLTLDEAISKVQADHPEGYEGRFIHQRDLAFLLKAKEVLHPKA